MSSRCLSWEQWEEETWTDSVTLNIALEGGSQVNIKPLQLQGSMSI